MTDRIADALAELERRNPDALLLEPRSVYDRALVGVSATPGDSWRDVRSPGVVVAVYDYDACIEALVDAGYASWSAAAEWVDFNVAGAWAGENTPAVVFRGEE